MGAGEKRDTASDRYLEPPAECVSSHARYMGDSTPRRMCSLAADEGEEETTTGCGYTLVADLTTPYRSAMGRAEMMGVRCERIDRLPLGNDKVRA
jgi:hypothetical protein